MVQFNNFMALLHFTFCWINTVSLSSGQSLNTTQYNTKLETMDNNAISEVKALSIPVHNEESTTEISNLRFKRQSGGGKFSDAAKMPQMKLVRLFLQLFSNSWSSTYVGGSHPLHHDVPKPVVKLYKHKIIDFFFPSVENEKEREP